MIPKHIRELIQKYKYGFIGGWHKPIYPNNNYDYEHFVEYLIENKKREGTIRMMLSYLHRWTMPLDKQNLVVNWDANVKLICDNSKSLKYYKKSSVGRLSAYLYLAISTYLKSVGQLELCSLIPHPESPMKVIRFGHISEEEFLMYNNSFKEKQFRILNLLLFYTGARINELLMCKKNIHWFSNYNGLLNYSDILEINIPQGFAKTNKKQKLRIGVKWVIEEVIDYINTSVKDGDYLFRLHPKINKIKNYKDSQKEQYVYRRKMKKGLRLLNLENRNLTIHGLRRSYIHKIYDYDKDIKFTSTLARTGIETTSWYLEMQEHEIKEKLHATFKYSNNFCNKTMKTNKK